MTTPNGSQQSRAPQQQALAPIETAPHAHALVPTSIDGAMQLARWLSTSTLLPAALKGKEPDIFMIVMAGMELGLPPMAALRGMYAVNGRTALEAKTKAAICLQRGAAEYFRKIEDTPLAVTWETKRQGDSDVRRSRYTLEEAKAAGLLSKDGPWKQYTQRMLSWRALGFLCDDAYPDVVLGIATAEDFEADAMTFKPISAGVELGAQPVAAKSATPVIEVAPAPAKAEPAAAAPPAKGPALTEDDAIEIITAFGKCMSKVELKKVAAERVAPATMDQAMRDRLVSAYEDQLQLIYAAEQSENGGGQ